jgi:glycerophosphoryl diester phosphodiesterase
VSHPVIPQLVAHRGYLRCFPENTWLALRAALDAGACWLEFDIQLCRDGQFVVLHDDSFVRTAGVAQSVFELDSHAIALSVHEPQRFGERFAPTPVATLAEILQQLSAWPRVGALVELKQESIDRWGLDTVMQKLLPLLLAHRSQCTLISFNQAALEWSRRQTNLPVGWVLTHYDGSHYARARAFEPDYLICNRHKLPGDQPPWPGPWQWMLYDITDPEQALAWAARGVALIETADIGAMLQDHRLKQRACPHAAL